MPDISRYKSIAVPIPSWEILQDIAKSNHRSPAQQVKFLIDVAKDIPHDQELLEYFQVLKQERT